MKRKKNERKKRNTGVINGFLNYLNDLIMRLFTTGFFANALVGNGKAESLEESSLLFGASAENATGKSKSIRRKLLKKYNESVLLRLLKKTVCLIRRCRLNVFGTYLFMFGACSTAVFFAKYFLEGHDFGLYIFFEESLIGATLMLLLSLPLLISTKTLSVLVGESRVVRGIFGDMLGIPEEKFTPIDGVSGGGVYFVAILFGILSGGLSYFMSPFTIMLGVMLLAVITVVMHFPEVGVLISIFIVPFAGLFDYPTVITILSVGVSLLSYIVKLSIGKRTINFKFTDAMVILLGLMFVFGGIVTSGGEDSLVSALTYGGLITVYFLIINLMNTEKWLKKCVDIVAFSSAFVALFGVLSYSGNVMPGGWIDADMFTGITHRAISTFPNPNMLATYLIMTAPFLWARCSNKNLGRSARILSGIGSIISLICVVLTWSRGGWIGYLVALFVYMLINRRYALKYLFVLGLTIPVAYVFIPENVIQRFTSIGNLSDSSTYYRLFTWKGSFKMLADYFISGIGVGSSAFHQIFPIYSYVGTEATIHSHNLFLEVAIELGIIGLAVFLLAMFGAVRAGFNGLRILKDEGSRVALSACIAGLAATLAHGMVDHVWYNYRVFFMFWVIIALMCAFSRFGKRVIQYSEANKKETNGGSATLDIVFDEK